MLIAAVGMKREARIVAAPGVRAVAGGGQADHLEQRLKASLDGADAIISIGIGGALDPALKVGDAVIGTAVLRPRARYETDAAWTARLAERLPEARQGAVFGSGDMVLHTLDKAKLRLKHRADLVDMESHVAGRLAQARGLPFAVLRVVSDPAHLSLPDAVRHGLTEDGDTNLMAVLGALARHPGQLPALMRTGRDAGAAFKALSAICGRLGTDLAFTH